MQRYILLLKIMAGVHLKSFIIKGFKFGFLVRSESALKDSHGWCKVIDDAADFSARTLVKTGIKFVA